MSAELAVIDILRNDASVSALIGGASARVYPLMRPQGSGLPAVTVDPYDSDPHDTKSGVSKMDDEFIGVHFYASTYSACLELAVASRFALDRKSGSYNGVDVLSIRYLDRDSWTEEINNSPIYVIEHNYKIMISR